MLRVLKVLEFAWLGIALFSLFMGAYQYNEHGLEPAKWFFGGALVAGAFFAFRRTQRKKIEKEGDQTDQN